MEGVMRAASDDSGAGDLSSKNAAKSDIRQLVEKVQLKIRGLHTFSEYECYAFGERRKDYHYMLGFMTTHALRQRALPVLNDPGWLPVLLNKWLFHLHCKQFGIPSPQVYGVFEKNFGFAETGEPLTCRDELRRFLAELQPANLVIKPLGGIQGKQVLVLDKIQYREGAIHATSNSGRTYEFSDLAEELERLPAMRFSFAGGYELELGGYLLQAKLQQHSVFEEIAPSTTNTVRVVTFRDKSNEVRVHATIMRLGRQGSITDNWDRGGLSVAIDSRTGELGRGVLKPKYGGQWMDHHPDSGARFVGKIVPYWSDVLRICIRAARVTPHLRSIGWDVVVTSQGPIIIEGNPDWDLMMVQVHSDGLLRTSIREQLAAFGLRFPEEDLPSFSLGEWWRRLKAARRERAFRSIRR
jgi:Sugar-transfer associated ATP-grasp